MKKKIKKNQGTLQMPTQIEQVPLQIGDQPQDIAPSLEGIWFCGEVGCSSSLKCRSRIQHYG